MSLEVGFYSKFLNDQALGRLPMLNLQPVFLAWLRAFKEAAVAANTSDFTEESLKPWVQHFNNVTMHFRHIDGRSSNHQELEKHILVYKMQERNEKSEDDMGHSTLTRAGSS